MKDKRIIRFVLTTLISGTMVSCVTPFPVVPTPIPSATSIPTSTPSPTLTATTMPSATPISREQWYLSIPYIPNGNFQQKLSIYLPADAPEHPEKTYPFLFLVHAYTMTKDSGALWDVIQHANGRGIAAVAIDYRDDPENGGAWPAHHDTACALAWVYDNALEYGLDVDRIVGFGNSYGGNLVTNIAMADDPTFFIHECPNVMPDVRPFLGIVVFGSGTFGLSGPDMMFATEKVADLLEDMVLFEGSASEILMTMQNLSKVPPLEWATYDGFSEKEKSMAQTWPPFWVSTDDPPFLIMTGDKDLDFWTLQDRTVFVELLQEMGVYGKHVLLPGADHLTLSRNSSDWQEPMDEFLDLVMGVQ